MTWAALLTITCNQTV